MPDELEELDPVDIISPSSMEDVTEDTLLSLDDAVSNVVEEGPYSIASHAAMLANAGVDNLTLAVQIIGMYQELVEWVQDALESFIITALYENDPQAEQEDVNEFIKSNSMFSVSSVYTFLSSLDEETFKEFYNSISDDELDTHIGNRFLAAAPRFVTDLFDPY